MLRRPSVSRLVEVISRELRETVSPAVSDQEVRRSLEMIDHVLSVVAIRCEHQIAWMTEAMSQIERLADKVMRELPEAGDIGEALEIYRSNRTRSLDASMVTDDHDRVGEILSRIIEADDRLPAELRDEAHGILLEWVDRGAALAGDFGLVSR